MPCPYGYAMVSMANMVVCVFDSRHNAETTRAELIDEFQLDPAHVRLTLRSDRPAKRDKHEAVDEDDNFWGSIRSYFAIENDDESEPDEAIDSAGAVLTIIVAPELIQRILAVIERHEPVEVDAQAKRQQPLDPEAT